LIQSTSLDWASAVSSIRGECDMPTLWHGNLPMSIYICDTTLAA
jgi:hypothetical protein